ncbi:high mobility group protein D-like [Drosophila teissieri]|uniref:high mobility group protein D-like n=1 Tax=Drosophila teissieri TaxID=7243 RepID=UPI001CBA4A76|nr:high mobility group protein D-like [Drosophila teissieri]
MSYCGARPKKPMTAFMLWLNSAGREHIKSEHPEFKIQEVAVKGGELWRSMPEEDKSVWQESASQAMAEYKKELEHWNALMEHQKKVCLSQTYPDIYEAPLSTRFPNTNQRPTLFVYDCKDDSMAPICRTCFSKARCFH